MRVAMAALFLCLQVPAGAAWAQAVRGRLVGEASGRPVAAAFVILERADGTRAGSTLSDESGSPVVGAEVRITVWHGLVFGVYDTTVDANGFYRVCDVPSGRPLRLEAMAKGFTSVARELQDFDGSLLRADSRLEREAGGGR